MHNVGIFLFDDVEVLDFAGPFEVFSVTSELNNYSLLKTFTITSNGDMITAINGLKIIPDYSFASCPQIDILVIPGGFGSRKEIEKNNVLEWIKEKYKNSKITFSVCSGARLLGRLGILDGIKITTHHEVISHLKEIAPLTIIDDKQRFIDNGKVMTSAGISAGIDLSLHVIKKLFGREIVQKTINYMEYKIDVEEI